MKKISLFFIGFVLMSTSAFATYFPDVPQDHLNYNAIEYLYKNDVIHGYSDGTFRPDVLVNRAEAMKMITLGLNLDIAGSYDSSFSDVSEGSWFFPYVMSARKAGIVEGYTDGTFRPSRTVSLSESLKMIIESSKVDVPAPEMNTFVDVKRGDWFSSYMLYARNQNMILAYEDGTIRPHKEMNRGEFAEILYRMMTILEQKGKAFPIEKSWKEYIGKKIPFKVSYDHERWSIMEYEDKVVFYRLDKEFLQFSPFKIYPNSALVLVSLDKNAQNLARNDYFENIKKVFPTAQFKNFEIGGLYALEVLISRERVVDWYIYLPNKNVLSVYTEYGDGVLGYQNQQLIKGMLRTFDYSEIADSPQNNYSSLLSNIFANILVEGNGMTSLNLLPDKQIIETDTIGVGTGPVDYYYSNAVDYTFKYERSKDVILSQRQGRTTAF
jgi:hypothetical protein